MIDGLLRSAALLFIASLLMSLASVRLAVYASSPNRGRRTRRLLAALQGYDFLGLEGVTFQTAAGCGIACYRMLVRRAGLSTVDPVLEAERTPFGSNMYSLVTALRRSGLAAEGMRFKGIDQLRSYVSRERVSVLLLLRDGIRLGPLAPVLAPAWWLRRLASNGKASSRHWVCLEECEALGVVVSDPLCGRVRISESRIRRLWDGSAIVSHPGDVRSEDAASP